MSKFAPWTQEEAEKAAVDWCRDYQYSDKDRGDAFKDALKWAAAQIEKCETVDSAAGRVWTLKSSLDNYKYEAKLVGVREVEK